MARKAPIRVGDVVRIKDTIEIHCTHAAEGVRKESRLVVVKKNKSAAEGWILADASSGLIYDTPFAHDIFIKEPFLTSVYRASKRRGLINSATKKTGEPK